MRRGTNPAGPGATRLLPVGKRSQALKSLGYDLTNSRSQRAISEPGTGFLPRQRAGSGRGTPARRATPLSRRGFSLTEALLFAVLALFVFGAAWQLLTRSVSLTDETTRSLELQVGTRNLLENLVADVNGAHVILEPPGPLTSTLALIKYQFADGAKTLAENTRAAYPFPETDAETVDLLPAFRTTYTYSPEKKEVVRAVEKGVLAVSDEEATRGFLTKYEFRQPEKVYEKALATSVAIFSLTYVGYDPTGQPVPVEELPKPSYAKTAFLLVRLRSVFDEGLYAAGGRRTPTVDIATKIWSYKRLTDVVYGEYFSSGDDDARY